jgi:short-subunit dehydrogenase
MKKNVFILGANSDLAKSLSLDLASKGYDLTLFSRNINYIEAHITKLKNEYGISIQVHSVDLNNFDLKSQNINVNDLY